MIKNFIFFKVNTFRKCDKFEFLSKNLSKYLYQIV